MAGAWQGAAHGLCAEPHRQPVDAGGKAGAALFGGGIEFDVGRYEVSIPPLSLERVRLLGYYFFADNNVRGYSIALGFSF
jgi:hypothetical protein